MIERRASMRRGNEDSAPHAAAGAYNRRVARKLSTEVVHVSQAAQGANEHATGRFHVETDDAGGESALRIIGWVLGRSARATEVEILVGDDVAGRATVEIQRPDVAKQFPRVPHAATSGFKLTLLPQDRGESELLVRAVLESGTHVPMGTIHAKVSRRPRLSAPRRG
jgi:hypothetical protein